MSSMFVHIGAIENCLYQEVRYIPLKLVPSTVCAWCPDFDPRDPKNKGVSHGMCKACSERMKKEMMS